MVRKIRPGGPVRGSRSGRPLMAALDLLGRRWMLRILWELREGPLGFREVQSRCEGMSSSVLRDRLTELRDAQLIERTDDEKHQLTRPGRELGQAMKPLERWAGDWAKTLPR